MSLKSCFAVLLLGLCTHVAAGGLQEGKYDLTIRVQQCRGGCLGKYATRESLCVLHAECSACWDECAKVPKINKSIRETWSLRTTLMLQQDSLVLVDVAWDPLSTGNQCLVTWEVSGGGLMGNLLTESFNVQLSLWPDTKYRVQVTCKNKLSGAMSRSLPLTIDTSEATTLSTNQDRHAQLIPKTPLMITSTTVQPPSNPIQETIPSSNSINSITGGVPFEDQSSESINQHTNFIFNWHQKNSDISKIEPLTKPDLNILRITSISEMQNPLLFDVIIGCIILIIILFAYMLVLRNQRTSSDKAALIEDDSHSYSGVSVPVAIAVQRNSGLPSSSKYSSSTSSSSSIAHPQLCKNPGICSRNALKV
ncbi:uncharacterized protein LOC129945414 [Eupeodes corollae]|uniref:uncharacterized protein LOC129945414 n=1 Tax=Eupeodes corollae TaxID=290404 RepID=UPI002491E2F4|nr:uncharacterized protein LOC129945414 [Eupeodes corollae]